MATYVARRVATSVVLLLLVMSFVFAGGRLIGDPVLLMLGPEARAEDIDRVRAGLGLAEPTGVQYAKFISGIVTGDFGSTYRYGAAASLAGEAASAGVPALPLVLERIPATVQLALAATALGVIFGVSLGVAAAVAARGRAFFDRVIQAVALTGVSLVEFWVAYLLIIVFSLNLGILPTSGYGSPAQLVLPAVTLALKPAGRIALVVRGAMLAELNSAYVLFATSKGYSTRRIVGRHALKNASVPSVVMISDELVALLTGVIVVEVVFAWPGIGSLMVDALTRRDLPLIEATIFVLALGVFFVNLMADIAYTRLNPRIQLR